MKKYCLVTTYYCDKCGNLNKESVKSKLNFSGDISDLYLNFSDTFSPYNFDNLPYVGVSKRKDLIYGKIFLLLEFVKENILGRYEYICHVDYSDVKFCKPFCEMMEKFENSNQEIIISTEKNCWPYLDTVRTWVDFYLEDVEFTFVNSGGVISRVEKFVEILEKLKLLCLNSKIDFWDDQGVWQYLDLSENIHKDSTCEYFFSTALLDETYFTLKDKKLITKFGTEPFVIHDNSSFSLNLTNHF